MNEHSKGEKWLQCFTVIGRMAKNRDSLSILLIMKKRFYSLSVAGYSCPTAVR